MDLEPPVAERSAAEDELIRQQLAQFETFGEKVSYLRKTLKGASGPNLPAPVITRFISKYLGHNYHHNWLWNIENGKRGKNPDKDVVRAFAAWYRGDQYDLVPSDLPPELRRISDALDAIGKMTVSQRKNPTGPTDLSEADYAGLAHLLETIAHDVRRRREGRDRGK